MWFPRLVLFGVSAVSVACSSSTSPSCSSNCVTIQDFSFAPSTTTIKVGTPRKPLRGKCGEFNHPIYGKRSVAEFRPGSTGTPACAVSRKAEVRRPGASVTRSRKPLAALKISKSSSTMPARSASGAVGCGWFEVRRESSK